LYKILKKSQEEHNASSSSINTQQESSTYNETEIEELIENNQPGTVYGRKSNNTSLQEGCSFGKDQSTENLHGPKTFDSSPSNHANIKASTKVDYERKVL